MPARSSPGFLTGLKTDEQQGHFTAHFYPTKQTSVETVGLNT
jgi:hypothetical protein